ncbi:hypothetical protein D2M30_3390 [Bacillus amyloliquefaciens]|nr:hypothetical protein D2M30_3390 [Bacillus amyloliquefaciens]
MYYDVIIQICFFMNLSETPNIFNITENEAVSSIGGGF